MNHPFTTTALILAAAGSLALAKSPSAENDAIGDLAKAKITLSQAVGVAEAHASGKATKAELDGEAGRVVYRVEIVTVDNRVFDIKVDASDGQVLSSKLDRTDGDEKDCDDH